MQVVLFIKAFIQEYRDDKWGDLLSSVKSFWEARNIDILDINA